MGGKTGIVLNSLATSMKSIANNRREEGYIDIQLPPVILGAIMLVATVHAIAASELQLTVSSVAPYLFTALSLLFFGFGIYVNLDSLGHEESPFNQHQSPLTILALVFGSLLYAIWRLYGTPFDLLFYILIAAVVAAIVEIIYLVLQLPDTPPE